MADEVITVGITHTSFRLEASGFHGREPGEYRWDIDSGKIDSWSTRVTFNPAANWSAQYSIAQLHSPESLAPEDDLRRMTASVAYNRPFGRGNWASLFTWGRNRSFRRWKCWERIPAGIDREVCEPQLCLGPYRECRPHQ